MIFTCNKLLEFGFYISQYKRYNVLTIVTNTLHSNPQYTRKLLHVHYIKCCGKDVSIFLSFNVN